MIFHYQQTIQKIMSHREVFNITEERDYVLDAPDAYQPKLTLKSHQYVIRPQVKLNIQFDEPYFIDRYDDGSEEQVINTKAYYKTRMLIFNIVNYCPVNCQFILEEAAFWNPQIVFRLNTDYAQKMMIGDVFAQIPVINRIDD